MSMIKRSKEYNDAFSDLYVSWLGDDDAEPAKPEYDIDNTSAPDDDDYE